MTGAETFAWLAVLLVCAATTYRVGRFVVLDTLIEELRTTVLNRLTSVKEDGERKVLLDHELSRLPVWRKKLFDLASCPHCVMGWISAASIAAADWFTSVPLPGLSWFAAWTGGTLLWEHLDPEPS